MVTGLVTVDGSIAEDPDEPANRMFQKNKKPGPCALRPIPNSTEIMKNLTIQ